MIEATRATRHPEWVPYALLAVVVLLAFGDVVSYPYVWDDFLLIELSVEEALQIPPRFVHVRPIWYLSHVITSWMVPAPWFDHLVNLLLFLVAVLLAYHFARTVTSDKRAAVAAGLWILVPWNVYPVA